MKNRVCIVIESLKAVYVVAALLVLATPSAAARSALTDDAVVIARTTDGIPHIQADNWYALGAGVGYVQAEDALCTLAEAFVTYAGNRSLYFGADNKPQRDSTFGRALNLELDFFFRAFADAEIVRRYREQQPADLNNLIEGFVVGYNRYLEKVRLLKSASSPSCLTQTWVQPITAADIYRRLYSAQVGAGYAHFIPEIANAIPDKAALTDNSKTSKEYTENLNLRLQHPIGQQAGIGSNMLAFGRAATGENAAVLLGNPHWYWGGPDRFYQMHLTIPGKLNVAGVAFLGVPVIMLGFNENVAWSHTVSLARRFGLFDLTLAANDATRYQIDGAEEAMTARTINVQVRNSDGSVRSVSRRSYLSRFGPIADLRAHDPALGWGNGHALVLRDANADNFRIFRNYFFWNQATSLDDFIAIQKRELAVPWANTAAIARNDGRVWYSDIGPAPNVSNSLRDQCTTARSRAYAQIDPQTPFLDGSRSACNWKMDRTAVQPGILTAAELPSLLRDDYVANMNDSYWLANPKQPLEGFASVLGGEKQALSLRGRLGHQMAQELMAPLPGVAPSARRLSERLMQAALTPRAYSAEHFKPALLQQACVQAEVVLAQAESSAKTRTINITAACSLLKQWNNQASADARGALLWDGFWAELEALSESELFQIAFSASAPLSTPNKPALASAAAAQALAQAVAAFLDQGQDPYASVGSQRFINSEGQKIPLFGGCQNAGYFTVACTPAGYGGSASNIDSLGPDSIANSYLQVVYFDNTGVNAHTLLAHGLAETAVDNGPGSAPIKRYANKSWLPFPFRQRQIDQDPKLQRSILHIPGKT